MFFGGKKALLTFLRSRWPAASLVLLSLSQDHRRFFAKLSTVSWQADAEQNFKAAWEGRCRTLRPETQPRASRA